MTEISPVRRRGPGTSFEITAIGVVARAVAPAAGDAYADADRLRWSALQRAACTP
ncbi:hypothetical protein [Microtetraspora malaysiensis]|uniref:hypothetical protein n=1 Tax=Microtetraspora malaysiensis TaxID=161358 RepID=UPI000AE7B9F2|nr:hypothetical protein [Microtetraspora malaysiensis]